MSSNGLLSSKAKYLEFGAGTAKLSNDINIEINSTSEQNTAKFYLIDRMRIRYTMDKTIENKSSK